MKAWYLILSDVFSIITIALCLILKVPQIIRLVKSGQASGLSLKSLLLELSSYSVSMMYNYVNDHALLSYLEYPILVVQEYALFGLVMYCKNYKLTSFIIVFLIYGSISFLFALNILNKSILTLLIPLTTPVGAFSKIMQLVEIISKKKADSVSVLTWFLSAFTNMTRIYTVYVDSADFNLLLNFTVSTLLSTSVMVATLHFQKLAAGADIQKDK